MDKIYELAGCRLKVSLDDGLVRVYSNAELWGFLKGNASLRFDLLVETIKKDYLLTFKKPLDISNNSLILEILVHVYCDYIGLLFNKMVKIKPIQILVSKLLKRAEVVDCGEQGKDSNRWVWDFLAGSKGLFIKLLPRNLNAKNLKLH
ncbi:hypothetical protein EZ449_08755 [Pedobacter frigidisoli]|uniref:Uncharacterized protein n=1 Tax=Pedobacter frigidisoli TaxID=2530455 RepID=A0A4R0P1T3_9SPHI|nr:hypothetical protein [Pedobacter frigidisoli]TCD10430.1 hypothetical protein EZ449_08755 [Pedobacter frigidisoli]